MTNVVPRASLAIVESDFAQLERHGVRYQLGAKAPLMATPGSFSHIDCSGYFRWALYRATKGALKVPDGSQRQREWAEENLRQVRYSDAAKHMTERRFFAAFIKPFTNGCGRTGHVWLLSAFNDGNNSTFAGTLESHGGAGINSRNWNYPTLLREVYSCFEIPIC
jgi:hypothetical protein